MPWTNPTSKAGLVGWGAADIGGHFTLTGSLVERWGDSSQAMEMYKPSDPDRPTKGTPGGLDGVTFADQWMTGVNSGTTTAYTPGAQPWTVYVVVEMTSPGTGTANFFGGDDGARIIQVSAQVWWTGGGTAFQHNLNDTALHIYGGEFNGASSEQWLDGVQIGTSNVGTSTPPQHSLGESAHKSDMVMREWAVWSSTFSGTDHSDAYTYFSRWTGGPPAAADPFQARWDYRSAILRR